MATMTISLPDALKSFVDEQAASPGHGTGSDHVRAPIRKDRDRQHLRSLLLNGEASPPASPADAAYFDGLHHRVGQQTTA
jgi:antitoxin ParD1/3/4